MNDAYLRAWNTIPPKEPEHLFAYVAQLCRYAALEKVDWLTAKKRNASSPSVFPTRPPSGSGRAGSWGRP